MYDDGLAATGAGGLLLGGHAIGLPTVITIAVAFMLTGLFLYRLVTRKQRAQTRS
ncbi:hypothetical protein [Phytoactinopolyspora halotolerans]|uniref:Uncharacterized protein n=1 Tax=Phytoactinopolyspora halotolerans TaxID=1981512 RepID=A0A6L9SHJ9_9ACTN|nr:hypothetical protein [Phytoactinopolyspora halotolerans]NEE04607.1 hypothetical protein [Phytoactinopolyspora halotolerans]